LGGETGHEIRRVFVIVQLTLMAGADEAIGIARVAGLEVLEASGQLALEGAKAFELGSGLVELATENLAHAAHGAGGGEVFPLLDDGADVVEGHAELLELADPAGTKDGIRTEKAVPGFASPVGSEQAHFFV